MVLETGIETALDAATLLRQIKEGVDHGPASDLALQGAQLAGADLTGLALGGADLSHADLTAADLSDADLSGADLTGADLSGARLFRAKLQGTILISAKLGNAELSGADLTGAVLDEADACRAGFGMACLRDARLFRAKLDFCTLSLADLEGADLSNASLKKARLREANLAGAIFNTVDLRGADLALCRVTGASFKNSDLRESRLRMVKDYQKADWIGVDLRDVNFIGAYQLRRFIMDQNFIMEFRQSGRWSGLLYYLWWISSDCGRSLTRWCGCIGVLIILYAWLYNLVGIDFGRYETWFSPVYFSIVTVTTLGYGDVVPSTLSGQVVAISEVIAGYTMLGGLISIFSNKLARRAD